MSRFGILPQYISLYPSDVISLSFWAGLSPALFETPVNASVTSSYELQADTNALFTAGIVQRLVSHIGSITLTLDSSSIPDTGGKIRLSLLAVSDEGGMSIEIGPTSTVVKQPDGTTIETVTHTPASGDTFTIEAAGFASRFLLNGVEETTYSHGSAVTYPYTSSITVTTPMTSATPKIQPPVLIGNWAIAKTPPFDEIPCAWTVTGGTLSDSSDQAFPRYTAPTTPGRYTATIVVGGEANQTSTATITVAPLEVLEDTIVELGQGATYRFKTNYDNAQTAGLVAWSVVTGGGGSFDASGLYTAPTTPGDYTIRATSGLQRVDLTVRVSNEITPDYDFVKVSEQVDWNSNMTGTLTWSASAGSINSSSGVWTAPSVDGQYVTITVTNGTATETRIVQVLTAFPYDPTLTQEVDYTRRVLLSVAEDGTTTGRVKNLNDASPLRAELQFNNRDSSEAEAVLAFWRARYPHRAFMWEDKIRSTRHAVHFDSDLRWESYTDGSINYSFRIRERA